MAHFEGLLGVIGIDFYRIRPVCPSSQRNPDWSVNQAVPIADVWGFTADPQTYDENRALDDFGGFSSLTSF
jgi:hypothetical protein